MVGIYFSGTGNTKYGIETLITCLKKNAEVISIESEKALGAIQANQRIILAYPVYYSNLPKIMHDFLIKNHEILRGKKFFLVATMALFSGDGTGCCARLLRKYNAEVVGGIHLKMPDCISDVPLLKKTEEQNRRLLQQTTRKIQRTAKEMKHGKIPREGLGFLAHLAGLFGQRLWFYPMTKRFFDHIKIRPDQCIGCGRCVSSCPMKNLSVKNGKIRTKHQCTLCYRCVNLCPKQAITLLGKETNWQYHIEMYKNN